MASYGGTLYASGGFSPTFTTGIAKWNGTTWSTLSPGFNAGAYASVLMPFNGYLYAGGGFTNAGPSGAKHLATWDGTTWRQGISGNSVDNTVFAFDTLSSPKIIYAGGLFSNPYSRVMRSNSLVAIEEQSLPEESVSIFPNPATDNILISLRSELKNPQVEIYNVAGEKIYSQMLTTRQKTINIRNYAAGIYFVKITSAGNDATGGVKALTKKIVIE
jgi:hypothetical protein